MQIHCSFTIPLFFPSFFKGINLFLFVLKVSYIVRVFLPLLTLLSMWLKNLHDFKQQSKQYAFCTWVAGDPSKWLHVGACVHKHTQLCMFLANAQSLFWGFWSVSLLRAPCFHSSLPSLLPLHIGCLSKLHSSTHSFDRVLRELLGPKQRQSGHWEHSSEKTNIAAAREQELSKSDVSRLSGGIFYMYA